MTAERHRETNVNPKEKSFLTSRQREILILLAEGRTYKEVSRFLGLSFYTVKSHLTPHGIYERLGTSSATGAVVEAIRQGVIKLEEISIIRRAGQGEDEEPLSGRQIEILKLAASCKRNSQIADLIGISTSTVKNQFYQQGESGCYPGIFERLQVPSRTSAVVRALQLGIFSLDDIFSEDIPLEANHLKNNSSA
jgi:DNA-binding NarL/FixJ family response regulator